VTKKKCFFLVSIWRDGGRLLATFAGALRRPTLATGGVRTMARIIRRAHAPKKKCFFFGSKQRSLLDRFGADAVPTQISKRQHRRD
jgi:hypothetical protein